jgi:DnaK suppressor protein
MSASLGGGWSTRPLGRSKVTLIDNAELQAIQAELEARRDSMRARIAALSKRPERGSGLGFGKRIGDGTTEAVGRLTDIGVGQSLEQTLARTERALAKLDEGTYGSVTIAARRFRPGACERCLTVSRA